MENRSRERSLPCWFSDCRVVPGLRPGTFFRVGAVAVALVVAGLVTFRRALHSCCCRNCRNSG